MSWIQVISYAESTGVLRKVYKRVAGKDGQIDNILLAHSLRPHTLTGHMTLYKNVLHHSGNTLPRWYLEAVGVYVSWLNGCAYCVDHHLNGLQRLIGVEKGERLASSMEDGDFTLVLEDKYSTGMSYAKKLTKEPVDITETELEMLKIKGFDDGEILELNQVVAYFNYANRTVLGLGVNTEGDFLGLSPSDSDDPKNWGHE